MVAKLSKMMTIKCKKNYPFWGEFCGACNAEKYSLAASGLRGDDFKTSEMLGAKCSTFSNWERLGRAMKLLWQLLWTRFDFLSEKVADALKSAWPHRTQIFIHTYIERPSGNILLARARVKRFHRYLWNYLIFLQGACKTEQKIELTAPQKILNLKQN